MRNESRGDHIRRRLGRSGCVALTILTILAFTVVSATAVAPAAHAHAPRDRTPTPKVPRPSHTIVVILENHSYSDIVGSPDAPYLNSLAKQGALFTHSFAITHPSEPNYLALFSGSTHGITTDSCPHTLAARSLGYELRVAKDSFVGYSEGLPATGYTGCSDGAYARKHSPWVNFSDLPRSVNRPFTAFPARFVALPKVSFVIPNLNHDMHDGTIAQADTWIKHRLGRYIRAAQRDNGLVVITWDEDDYSQANQIPTIVVGEGVRPGHYAEHIDHYRVLRTLEAAYGLPALGVSAHRTPITNIWKKPAA